MSTNKQRRESERARLQRQLEERREREITHRRFVTIASVVGALVLVAAVVVVIVVATSGGSDKPAAKSKKAATPTPTPTPTSQASTPVAQAPAPLPTTPCAKPGKGSAATTAKYAGLTITGATNLKTAPKVTGKAAGGDPTTVQCDDLVVGTGKAASTSAQATVEYVGLVYKTGKVFQSSWDTKPATFPLAAATPTTQGVITGFSQGIAGAGKVAPMKVGGRRVIVMPASAAYGANPPDASIPANASLVFVVDLQKLAS